MIIKRPFVIIGHLHVACPAEQVTAQLQHIIRAASLPRIAVQEFGEVSSVKEMFFLAATPRCKRMMVNHRMPEEIGQLPAYFVLRQLIVTCFGNHFRDKSIGMLGSQIIAQFFQRVYHIVVIKILRQPAIVVITGNGI